jgi:hypothetical protein
MSKALGKRTGRQARKRAVGRVVKSKTLAGTTSGRRGTTSHLSVGQERFDAVMRAAEQSGLLNEKSSRIGGRVSSELVTQAKKQTGIEADTDLIEFALANVALEDKFSDAFRASRGKVDQDVKLGF